MFTCLYAPPRGLAFRSDDGVLRAKQVTSRLVYLAQEYSPRIQIHDENLVVLDTTGLTGMFGNAREFGAILRRSAANQGLYLRIAVASTRTAALLAVQKRSGLTVIDTGREAGALASLPIDVLKVLVRERTQETREQGRYDTQISGVAPAISTYTMLPTLRRWGIKNLGELAHLPSSELFERLGLGGLKLQRFARGEDECPLVPATIEERFESSLILEWPVEKIEPLSLVLSRVIEQLSVRLGRAGVAASVIHVHLKLVTREVHTRTLRLPTPLHEPGILHSLILLDLESHYPSAGIDQVTVVVDPVMARSRQSSLFGRARTSTEKIPTLVARLTALVGEGRCGSPALVDSHDATSFEMRRFSPEFGDRGLSADVQRPRSGAACVSVLPDVDPELCRRKEGSEKKRDTPKQNSRVGSNNLRKIHLGDDCRQFPNVCIPLTRDTKFSRLVPMRPMLRRFRVPVAARVRVLKGRPVRVTAPQMSGGEVVHGAGPWRTSGRWWADGSVPSVVPVDTFPFTKSVGTSSWDRDEWDVSLTDGGVYRIFHDRRVDLWFLEGVVD